MEERSYERFLVFSHAKKQVLFKNTQNQRAKLIFSKIDKNLLFNGEFFQQVLLTWNENLCERSEKTEVEDRIQKTDGEDEETVLAFLVNKLFLMLIYKLFHWVCKLARIG